MVRTVEINVERIREDQLGIQRMYDMVARALGVDPRDVSTYDCKKIEVSEEIANAIEEAVYADDKVTFSMHWLCFGPKVNKELHSGEVRVEDGFINE